MDVCCAGLVVVVDWHVLLLLLLLAFVSWYCPCSSSAPSDHHVHRYLRFVFFSNDLWNVIKCIPHSHALQAVYRCTVLIPREAEAAVAGGGRWARSTLGGVVCDAWLSTCRTLWMIDKPNSVRNVYVTGSRDPHLQLYSAAALFIAHTYLICMSQYHGRSQEFHLRGINCGV